MARAVPGLERKRADSSRGKMEVVGTVLAPPPRVNAGVLRSPRVGETTPCRPGDPALLMTFGLISMVGIWIERHVLVMPSLNAEHVWVGLPEIGVTIGFLGMFGWTVQGFLSKYPVVNVMDVLDSAGGHGH